MATKKQRRQAQKAAEKAIKKAPAWLIITAIILIAAIVAGYFIYTKFFKKPAPLSGELSFHFLELGNKYSGDSIYIKAGDNDILIDAGSRVGSIDNIKNYVNQYMTDNTFEYVIVTHADRDHIAGFAASTSIFDLYECETIIGFPLTDKTTETYNNYLSEKADEVLAGATYYDALQCYNQTDGAKRVYNLTDTISMEILYNYYYEHSHTDENNYSVCVMFHHGDRDFLFTGDLEEAGEIKLAQKYDFGQVELFKAGHHGSATSSNDILLREIKPKVCVVTCAAGWDEFTDAMANQFPTQKFIDNIAPYTNKVYVTTIADSQFTPNGEEFYSLNGNVVVSSSADKDEVEVTCSASSTLLKDTSWFKAERTTPAAWLN